MRVLGAILLLGEPLDGEGEAALAASLAVLSRQCTSVCVVGCQTRIAYAIPPWPRSDAGDLAHLAGALRHARDLGLQHVLSFPASEGAPPPGLLRQMVPAPAYSADAPLVGLWTVADLGHADLLLATGEGHDVSTFAALSGARTVTWRRQS